jgi:hypothetical protein
MNNHAESVGWKLRYDTEIINLMNSKSEIVVWQFMAKMVREQNNILWLRQSVNKTVKKLWLRQSVNRSV